MENFKVETTDLTAYKSERLGFISYEFDAKVKVNVTFDVDDLIRTFAQFFTNIITVDAINNDTKWDNLFNTVIEFFKDHEYLIHEMVEYIIKEEHKDIQFILCLEDPHSIYDCILSTGSKVEEVYKMIIEKVNEGN